MTPDDVVANVEAHLDPGGCVLLHDTDRFSVPGVCDVTRASLAGLADLFAGRGLAVGPLGRP
jgi:hypothetical protein